MPRQFTAARPGFGDRLRLMAFSIIILLTVALATVIVTVFHFRVFPQTSHEHATRLAGSRTSDRLYRVPARIAARMVVRRP